MIGVNMNFLILFSSNFFSEYFFHFFSQKLHPVNLQLKKMKEVAHWVE